MHIKLKDGSKVLDRRLDCILEWDEQNRMYGIADKVPEKPKSVAWTCDQYLDQGKEGACVGFGFAHEAIATPVHVEGMSEKQALQIYHLAQDRDLWPGHFYSGTTVNAGCKAAVELGYCDSYRWGFGFDELLLGLAQGPAVIGVNWTQGMFDTNEHGFIQYTGKLRGKHCTMVIASNCEDEHVWIHNSWGSKWGVSGRAKMSFADMEKLLDDEGQCVFLCERHAKPKCLYGTAKRKRKA